MGLGKTVQTLLCAAAKENHVGVPTCSLCNLFDFQLGDGSRQVYTGMKILNYTGIHREKDVNNFVIMTWS